MAADFLLFPMFDDAGSLQFEFPLPLHNLTATVDPDVSDDDVAGYVAGSRWTNVSANTVWRCLDNSTGAAVWEDESAGGVDSSAATGIAHVSSGTWTFSAVNLASGDVTGLLPNGNLANSSLTVNGTTISLGGSGVISAAPSGSAGGDLSGTFPNPTVDKIGGVAVTVDTDGTLAANSDARLATQKAVKTFVSNAVTGLLEFQGTTDCSGNPNYPAAMKGDAYAVTVAGKIGGASGKSVDARDWYVAIADNAGGTEASVGSSWDVLEHNLVGALLSANNLSDLASASTARTNLGLGTAATQAASAFLQAANNLSDLGSASTARTNLGATTVGSNLLTLTNPSAITFTRINADNSVSALSASAFRTAIGAGTGTGDLVAANNLSDVASASTSRTNLGATTIGANLFTLTNPGATTFPRFNSDNSVDSLSASSMRTALGVAVGSDVQPYDATLTALSFYSTDGFVTHTATDTFTGRSIAGTSNEVSVSNGNGVSGNPTLSLPSTIDLSGKTWLKIPIGTSPTVNASGQLAIDSDGDGTNVTQGLLAHYDGTQKMWNVAVDALPTTNGYVLRYNSSSHKFEFAAGGGDLLAANNLSDLASAATARTNLGGTTVGKNLFTLTNPSAITFPRFNADNTVTALSASAFLTAIGGGTVSSVASGTGLTGGPITTTGTLSLDISGLTATDVATDDTFAMYDQSAAAIKKISVDRLLAWMHFNGYRVTPQTGVSKIVTDSTAVTQLFLTVHRTHDLMTLYDGTRWVLFQGLNGGSDLSVKLTDSQTGTTTSGNKIISGLTSTAQLARGMKVTGTGVGVNAVIATVDSATQVTVDVNSTSSATNTITFKLPQATMRNLFLVYNGGTPRMQWGVGWSGLNTEADSIGKLNGVSVNTAAVASGDHNSIPANQGRLLARVMIRGADGQTMCVFGGATSQVGGQWMVANVDNPEEFKLAVIDTTDNWAYGTDTVRQANGAAGNLCEFVLAYAGDSVSGDLRSNVQLSSNSARAAKNGIGVDATNAFSGLVQLGYNTAASTVLGPCNGKYESSQLSVGYHYLAWCEKGADGTSTFHGDNSGSGAQSGLYVTIKA